MPVKKTHDIAVVTGQYEKDGETKNRYENVGTMLKGDNGSFIILKRTFNPAGVINPEERDTVLLSMFAVKTEEPKQTSEEF